MRRWIPTATAAAERTDAEAAQIDRSILFVFPPTLVDGCCNPACTSSPRRWMGTGECKERGNVPRAQQENAVWVFRYGQRTGDATRGREISHKFTRGWLS